MKQIATRNFSKLSFGLSVIVILIVIVFAAINLRALVESNNKVSHTLIVLRTLDKTHALITEAETSQRGYIITGDEQYLAPYYAAVSSNDGIRQHLQELRQLTSDDPNQQQRLDLLESLMEKKLAIFVRNIDLRRNTGFTAAQEALITGGGRQTMDEIRQVIGDISMEESDLLQSRSDAASASLQNTLLTLVTGVGLSLSLLLSSFYIVNREVGVRRRAEEALQQLNRELDQRVEQRISELAASERSFRNLADSALIGIFRSTTKGEILYVNQTLAHMLGHDSPEEMTRGGALLHYRDPQVRQTFIEKLQREGKVESYELSLLTKSGQPVTALISARIEGEQLTGTLLDITERKRAEEKLVESEQYLNHLIDSMPIAVYVCDSEGRITQFNQRAMELWQRAPVLSDPSERYCGSFRLFYPDGRFMPHAECPMARALLTQTLIQNTEIIIERPDGSRATALVNPIVLRNQSGEIIGAVNCVLDITERKRAEEQLERLGRRTELILNSAGEGIYGVSMDGEINFANPAAVQMLGYAVEELIGQQGHTLLHHTRPDGSPYPRDECPIYAAFRDGRPQHADDEVFWRRDGSSFRVEYFSNPMHDEHDALIGAVVTFKDITERVRSADQLNYHARLLRHINDAVIATDDQLRLTAWNRAAEKMYGWNSEEVMGRTITEILSFDFTDEQRAAARELLKDSMASRSERLYHRRDGQTIYVEANTISLLNQQGRMTGYVSVHRDITERKRAEVQAQLQIQRLKALRAIDIAISSSFDISLTLDILLDQVIAQLNTDAAAVLMFHPVTSTLEYAASRGFRSLAIREVRLRLGEGYAGKAILERHIIHISNLVETDSELAAFSLKAENFIEYYCVPLVVKGEVKGVLEIFHRSALAGGSEWLDFLETLAGQAALAIDNATLFENLQHSNRELFQAYDATIEGWSHALDLRDKETEGHSQRVTETTLDLARKFGLTDDQLRYIRWGALLHDIGKMGVPDSILLKPDKLTDEEWDRMKKHPDFAFEMLSPIAYLKSSLDIPYCHHEKWDGTGYPRGLKGEVIPLAARLFAIVDVWDALRSDRPYRKAWTLEKTLEHIQSLSGTHFDPQVVEIFLKIIK